MEFKISKLQYAYTTDGIASISIANKEREYFLDEKLTIPLVFCSGEKNVNYWRKKSNISEYDLNRVFGNSESIQHYNKKMEIANSLEFVDRQLNIKYKAHSSKVEYHIKSINKIVDVAFFDKEGSVFVCIEVLYTNKKTQEDISKFNQENIIIYEYDIQSETSYVISAGVPDKELSDRIREDREYLRQLSVEQERTAYKITQTKEKIRGIKQSRGVAELERTVNRLTQERNKRWRDYYEEETEAKSKAEKLKGRIRRKENRILQLKEDRLRHRELEEEVERNTQRIRAIREEIIQIESNEQ